MHSLELNFLSTSALWHCLNNTEAKGYGVGHHAKVTKAVKRDVMNDLGEENWGIKSGTLNLDDDRYKYAKDIVKAKIEGGIPGVLAEGYSDLNDAIGDAEEAVKSEE